MKLSVILPAYNEKETIREIIEQVLKVNVEKEIIVVDDFSTDGTREILKEYDGRDDVRVLYHEKNKGKGAALNTGFSAARGDYVIIQDADFEYNPEQYLDLLKPVLDGDAEVVYGSRFLNVDRHQGSYFWHTFGNKFLTKLCGFVGGAKLTDMETCYKLFPAKALEKITIRSKRFTCEPEMTLKLLRQGYKIHEVPISYKPRGFEEGKKITWKDGIAAIFAIFYYRIFN